MMPAHVAAAWFAGLATLLSPCLLPIMPFAVAQGLVDYRGGLVAWMITFAAAFAATAASFGAGLPWWFIISTAARSHAVWAAALIGVGLVIGPRILKKRSGTIVLGALIGALSGLIWQPCAGYTLAQILNGVLANHAVTTGLVELVVYAVGAALPLAALAVVTGVLTRHNAVYALRGAGLLIIAAAVGIASGADAQIQTALAPYYPAVLP